MSAPVTAPPASAAVPGARKLSAAEFAEYLLEIGGTLLSYGCSTHRLEQLVREVARLEGYEAHVFAVPTGIFLTLQGGELQAPLFRMIRVEEWSVDLERLMLVDRIVNEVAAHELSIVDARLRLHELDRRPPPYPRALVAAATAGAAGAAAVFFRGGPWEALLGAIGGAAIGAVVSLLGRSRSARYLSDFVGAVVAALIAGVATRIWPELSREVLVLSGVILLVPGMALTTGLSELARKNLVSGAARLMEALITFLSIVFGIAMVVGFESMLGGAPATPTPPQGLSLPFQGLALLIASLSFGVLFRVPRRWLVTAVASGAVAWIATLAGAAWLPAHIAAFAAALALCLFANGVARVTRRPSQAFLLPGMVLLVPGSFGFRSLEALLRGDLLGGALKGFEMFLIAGALVTGLLVANVLLPARKIL